LVDYELARGGREEATLTRVTLLGIGLVVLAIILIFVIGTFLSLSAGGAFAGAGFCLLYNQARRIWGGRHDDEAT
jgi:energy-converting hydrogenase Eha subunit G